MLIIIHVPSSLSALDSSTCTACAHYRRPVTLHIHSATRPCVKPSSQKRNRITADASAYIISWLSDLSTHLSVLSSSSAGSGSETGLALSSHCSLRARRQDPLHCLGWQGLERALAVIVQDLVPVGVESEGQTWCVSEFCIQSRS